MEILSPTEIYAGGIYNPGVDAVGDRRIIIARAEKDLKFSNDVDALCVIGEMKSGEFVENTRFVLQRVGFPVHCRIEDYRCFRYKGDLFVVHTLVETDSKGKIKLIKPVISKIDIYEGTITLWDMMMFQKMGRVEKNWLPFEKDGELYCLYSIDPLVIYKVEGWSWVKVVDEENGLQERFKNRLSLSAMVPWFSGWLVGYHSIVNGMYHNGFLYLDEDLEISLIMPTVLNGDHSVVGNKTGVIYVTGLVDADNTLEVWYGYADQSTHVSSTFTGLIEKEFEEFSPKKFHRLCCRDLGIGDIICLMYAVSSFCAEHPDDIVRLYVRSNMDLLSLFDIPNLRVHIYSDDVSYDYDLTSTEEPLYTERLKGSFKRYYSDILGIEPRKPLVKALQPLNVAKKYVVLAPFAAYTNRTWKIRNWKLLSELLHAAGYEVVILDNHPDRSLEIKGIHKLNFALSNVFSIINDAEVVISNESGVAHIAGILGKRCIVLSGWLDPSLVYDMTENEWIFKPKALQEIDAYEVIEKITCLSENNKIEK